MGAGISYGDTVNNLKGLTDSIGEGSSDKDSNFNDIIKKKNDTQSEQNNNSNSEDGQRGENSEFSEAIAAATNQLQMRQRRGQMTVTDEEMDDLVLLSRQLQNYMASVKRFDNSDLVLVDWKTVEESGQMDDFGTEMYDNLLKTNPFLRVFFYGVNLKDQASTLIRMLGTAVYSLHKPEVIGEVLVQSGARHRGFGVTTETFRAMERNFFDIFPKYIGEEAFERSREGWEYFWSFIIKKLDQGNCSRDGEVYAQMYEERNLTLLQKDWTLLCERQAKCDARHQFVGTMYAKAMEMYGDLSKFDALRDLRAASRVFQSYVDIVGMLGDKEKADEYMLELGARHVAYNVTVENLISFTEPFLYACRHFLQNEWNVAMEARFLNAFRYMIDGITTGMVNGMNSMENKRAPQSSEEFCLIFTDIEGSTNLWQKNSHAMGHAVKQHHRLIRSLIAEYGAYEVKTVGDSFIIATKDVLLGLKICIAIQLELMRMAPIAPNFEMLDVTEGYGDPEAWNNQTLRVRIGMEYSSDATATYDTIHRRYDYYGPSVNRCARIESAACGGQILTSIETYNALMAIPEFHNEKCEGFFRGLEIPSPSKKLDDRGLDSFVAVEDIGLVKLKGIGEPVHLISLLPVAFKGRKFIDKVNRVASQ